MLRPQPSPTKFYITKLENGNLRWWNYQARSWRTTPSPGCLYKAARSAYTSYDKLRDAEQTKDSMSTARISDEFGREVSRPRK